jgi:hypothetical protein
LAYIVVGTVEKLFEDLDAVIAEQRRRSDLHG